LVTAEEEKQNQQGLGAVFTKLNFLGTYNLVQNDTVLHYTRLERLAKDKNYSLLVPSINYEKMKCCE
jgi:hypothetical protein